MTFVQQGGSKAEAARRFQVSRSAVYDWLGREDLAPMPHGPHRHKLDRQAVRHYVRDHPDTLLRERATHCGVTINAIWYQVQQLP